MAKCADCYHEKENHQLVDGGPNAICNGSLQCRCEKFIEPYLVEFAALIEIEKIKRKSIKSKCMYILQQIPQTRNAGEKTFAKIYKEIWYGFKIRKAGTRYTTEEWKRMPHDDTINREKRRCKQYNDNLRTYDPETLKKQSAIYQACLELAAEV